MIEIKTSRLRLRPFAQIDFDKFVTEMLTDVRVVKYYYAYQGIDDLELIRAQAREDFWEPFEYSRNKENLEIWAAYGLDDPQQLIGWSGLLYTSLSEKYGGPELQYMLAGDAHNLGYATELASGVLQHATDQLNQKSIIATVDIPNTGSIRVLNKLGFEHAGQIEAYGSSEMYLFRKGLVK